MQRRTRIVATLGPATDPPAMLQAILGAGVDVARINFSHGSGEEPLRRITSFREAARGLTRSVGVLADLPGPKLRALLPAALTLDAGREVVIRLTDAADGDFGVTLPEALREVHTGQRVLLDDGRLQLRVVRPVGDRVHVRVEVGGTLLPNKGVNLPETRLNLPALSPRDREALAVAAHANVDWLAMSFVRKPDAADELRAAALELGLRVPVLAKIERPEAVGRASEIIEAFDGIMVARGDLGVEIALEKVPHVQKQLIAAARAAGKPVVTATEMLDSMKSNPRPTRAEASDVANAIYDGTDAVMLSAETAVGQYPAVSVAYMERIIREAESHVIEAHHDLLAPKTQIDDHVATAACELARDLGADAIVTPTLSGRTARLLARHRPKALIVAPVPSESVRRQLALVWGVLAVPLAANLATGQGRLDASVQAATAHGALLPGQLAVLLAGHPIEGGERMPTIRVVRVGPEGRAMAP